MAKFRRLVHPLLKDAMKELDVKTLLMDGKVTMLFRSSSFSIWAHLCLMYLKPFRPTGRQRHDAEIADGLGANPVRCGCDALKGCAEKTCPTPKKAPKGLRPDACRMMLCEGDMPSKSDMDNLHYLSC